MPFFDFYNILFLERVVFMKILKEDNGNILLVLNELTFVNELKSNDVDASFEKHVPQMKKIDNTCLHIRLFPIFAKIFLLP